MGNKIFNEFSKENTVAFWITISIGIILLLCLVFLFVNYATVSF